VLSPGITGIRLQDYVCGGYYLARLTVAGKERPLSPRLPAGYFSASGCISDFFPDSWVWNYAGPMDCQGNLLEGISGFEERLVCAAPFGITAEQLPGVVRWGQLRCGYDFSVPHGFDHLAQAKRATEWITLRADQFVLFGIGLHRSLSTKLLKATTQNEDFTVPRCIQEGRELAQGGSALGHELLSYELGEPSHSWICSGCENDMPNNPRFLLNEHGYLAGFEAALEFTKLIERGEVGAEPGPWFPWLIVRYV
jgi:hypothetical protein